MKTNDDRCHLERVLDGDLTYDDLGSEEDQARVRQVWDERDAEHIAGLDFESEFTAQGRAWTEIDERGNAVRRSPDARRVDGP